DLGDLCLEMGATGGVLELAPQPIGDAGFGASGTSGALVGGRSTRADRRESCHPAAEIVSRYTSEAGVDDDPYTADRQRRFGDVGAQHHPPPPTRRRRQGEVLL